MTKPKYRIFSLESLEFVIERDVTYDLRWDLTTPSFIITVKEDFISLTSSPGDAIKLGRAKIKVFLNYKKAHIWVYERCKKYEDYGVTPDQFMIEAINNTV
jgi:hypothetical protein